MKLICWLIGHNWPRYGYSRLCLRCEKQRLFSSYYAEAKDQ